MPDISHYPAGRRFNTIYFKVVFSSIQVEIKLSMRNLK